MVNFVRVNNENEILRNVRNGYKYFVLATDVEITRTMTLPDGASICLNGYEFKVRRGVKALRLANDENVIITDCKHDSHAGKVTTGVDRSAGYLAGLEVFEVTRGTLSFINADIRDANYADTLIRQRFISISNVGNLVLDNAIVGGNRIVDVPFIDTSDNGNIFIASTSVINNIATNSEFIYFANDNVVISTMSVTGNSLVDDGSHTQAFIISNADNLKVINTLISKDNVTEGGTIIDIASGLASINNYEAINNTAYSGAGITIEDGGNAEFIKKARFIDNTAVLGGAILIKDYVEFTLSSTSEIINNIAEVGAAIAVLSESKLKVAGGGTVKIEGNKANANDVTLAPYHSIIGLVNSLISSIIKILGRFFKI